MRVVFFAFLTAKEQSQFAVSTIEDVEIKDISVEQPKGVDVEMISESVKDNPPQDIAVKNNAEVIEKNSLLMVVTPDGECVGIKVKYGMPALFDTEQSRQEWLKEATNRAIDLKIQIESGACTIESVKDMLDMKPDLSATKIEELISQSRAGLFFSHSL